MTLEETLNELLVKLFKDILEIEAKSLITEEFKDITYNDMHIIEAVGIDEPRNMKTVAKLMSVTTGTLTKAMLLEPSLSWVTVCVTVLSRCSPVVVTAGDVKPCEVPPMLMVLAVRAPMSRRQSLTR